MNIQSAPPAAALARQVEEPSLRILLTGYRSHPHVGGQGVYLRELARALRDLGHRVTVASGPPYPELDSGIDLVELPSLDLFEEANAFKAFRLSHLTSWADFSEWASHNTGAFGEPYAFGRRLARYLKAHPGQFDVVHDNQTLASALTGINRFLPVIATIHHPVAIHVSFNGIDHDVFKPDPSVERQPGLIAATASADVPIKGVDVLMDAFCTLAPSRPDLRLELIGRLRDGPARARLEASGLLDRVTCRSGVTREEIAALYRRANLVACPARFEGFGFPAAEAMACGAPVVASDGGALPEVVGDAGLVVPAGDAAAFAAAIASMLDDPGRGGGCPGARRL